MSYFPATKLSYDEAKECATVLTDGMVMVTKANGGLVRFQMKLVDWLILAEGKEQEEFIPLEPVNMTVPVSPIETDADDAYHYADYAEDVPVPMQFEDVPLAMASPAPLAAPSPIAQIGSKFKWVLDENNYRVAIVTKDGLLQVKSVTDGGGEVHEPGCPCIPCREIALSGGRLPPWRRTYPLKKTLFADEATWSASLPQGGLITLDGPSLTPANEKPRLSPGMSDADKIHEIQERFKVKSGVRTSWSLHKCMDHQLVSVEKYRSELAKVTLDEDLSSKKRHVLNLALGRAMRLYKYFSDRVSQDPHNANTEPMKIVHRGKNRLHVMINGSLHDIALKSESFNDDVIVVQPLSGPARVIKDLNEIGNPPILVTYRRKSIEIALN